MGRQIIKQPNGLYALWSSVIDNFVYLNLTKEEIIEIETTEAIERIEKNINKIINKLDNNEKPYYQFTLNWDETLSKISCIHGESEKKEINNIIKLVKKK